MKKRIVAIMLIMLLAVCLYAQAVETPLLTIKLTVPEDTKTELSSIGMEMSVYKVADIVDGELEFTESFSGMKSGTDTEGEVFAEEALGIILDAENPPEHEVIAGPDYSLGNFETKAVYLLVAGDGGELVTEKIDGKTATVIDAPLDIYRFSPILLIAKDETEADIELKYEVEDKLGDLIINKYLVDYREGQEVTFVFSVEWGGKVQKVEGITFSAAGSDTIRISGIPLGETVKVTEIYEGAFYEVLSEKTVETVILPPELKESDETEAPDVPETQDAPSEDEVPTAEVEFFNGRTPDGSNGSGIINRFTYIDGEWVWSQE